MKLNQFVVSFVVSLFIAQNAFSITLAEIDENQKTTINNTDFTWWSAGPVDNMECLQIIEPFDPNTWHDNYFCSSVDIGLQWSSSGPIDAMTCTQIHESADPDSWHDNYLCLPVNSNYRFAWSSAGGHGDNFIQWAESADPHTWGDNYLSITYQYGIEHVQKIHVIGSHYPAQSSGVYTITDSYNGYPVYSNQYYKFYRRLNGYWYLDFNDVSEDWDGTIDYTTTPAEEPWRAGLATGAVSMARNIIVADSHYPEQSSGEYILIAAYNGYPVYSNGLYHVYRRSNGDWFIDFNEVSEEWSGTIDYSLISNSAAPWLTSYATGSITYQGDIDPIQNVYVIDSHYPAQSSGMYTITDSYNGYPVYSNAHYSLYRRLDGYWYLDFNDVSEDWDGTIDYTTTPAEEPWRAGLATGAISQVLEIDVADSHYPTQSSGVYSLVASYNGYPVYSNGVYHVYRRSNGEWFLDFDEVSEEWSGTIDFSLTSNSDTPWLTEYATGSITINSDEAFPLGPYLYNEIDGDNRKVIDALFIITPDAKQDISDYGQTPTEYLSSHIAALNETLLRSKIFTSTVRLLGIHELLESDFDRIGNYPNGSLNNMAHALGWLSSYRESYGADKVLLIGSNSESNNGGAYGSGDLSSYFVDFLPIEHEFGHMMGASHCNDGQVGELNYGYPLAGYTNEGFPIEGGFAGTRMCSNNVAFYSNPDIFLNIDEINTYVAEGLMPLGDYAPYLDSNGLLQMGDDLYANVAQMWRDNETGASQRVAASKYSHGPNPHYAKDDCVALYAQEGFKEYLQEVCVGDVFNFHKGSFASFKLGKNVHVNFYSDPDFGASGGCGGEVLKTAFSSPSITNLSQARGLSGFSNKAESILVYPPSDRSSHFYFNGAYDFYSSAQFMPHCSSEVDSQVRLLDDLIPWSSTAMVLRESVSNSFAVDFSVRSSIVSDHPHGEGFTFFFAKDGSEYDSNTLTWDELGFLSDGKGYAIQFHDVINRVALIDGNNNILGEVFGVESFTNNEWVDVRIEVSTDRVAVIWNNNSVLSLDVNLIFNHNDVGFGVGTGFYTSSFDLKDLVIEDTVLAQ